MMKKERFLNFEQFILEESCTQRTSAISTAVSKIKEEFGDTKEKFLKSAEEKGVDDIKDFIVKTLEPYVERVEGQEKVQTGEKFILDFDELLSGLASWMLVEIEINQMKNKKGKE
ncbi:MAG: hypothetical protein SO162_07010 [Candidatus Onthomorpha sp.]|nr:hypothetical protein [Candidatus Onthomorpha sp.]